MENSNVPIYISGPFQILLGIISKNFRRGLQFPVIQTHPRIPSFLHPIPLLEGIYHKIQCPLIYQGVRENITEVPWHLKVVRFYLGGVWDPNYQLLQNPGSDLKKGISHLIPINPSQVWKKIYSDFCFLWCKEGNEYGGDALNEISPLL